MYVNHVQAGWSRNRKHTRKICQFYWVLSPERANNSKSKMSLFFLFLFSPVLYHIYVPTTYTSYYKRRKQTRVFTYT